MRGLKIPFYLGMMLLAVLPAAHLVGQAVPSPVAPTKQDSAAVPAHVAKTISLDEFIGATIAQERRMTGLVRNFRPIVETYIQEEGLDANQHLVPKADDYFLTRLDLSGKNPVHVEFVSPEHLTHLRDKNAEGAHELAPGDFAEAAFPDLGHFDRQHYAFEFVRREALGEVQCAVLDVTPTGNSESRGFVGRMWVEDQHFNIVRFNGAFTAKAFAKRSFHFDSWRLNTLGVIWMPAYIYTQESDPKDSSQRGIWLKAQTRLWGYDLAHAGDHREFAKPLTDTPIMVDPKRQEASQNLSPEYTVGKTAYSTDDQVVERLQVTGLMAPDGDVDRVLETVVNNLLVTNDLDLTGIRCRVLLTTPLESFVVGQTIVVSRGLLDVLPDEATLAAVLAHELAHIVLKHSMNPQYLLSFTLPFRDAEIFSKFDFHFDAAQEAEADKKGLELIAKSPYKDKLASMGLFLDAMEHHSTQLPNLLHGRFSNDFATSHLVGMPALAPASREAEKQPQAQLAALPLGSRIRVDPWSNGIQMLGKPAPPSTAAEEMLFEVSPFFPYLKRLAGY